MDRTHDREKITSMLERFGFLPGGQPEFVPLHGDASARRYVRITGLDGGRTLVAMLLAPETARFSEEAMSGPPPEELPFLEMQRVLSEAGVDVPRVFGADEQLGVVLLEDLGDQTLEREVSSSPERTAELYARAVELLVDFQKKTSSVGDCIARKRAFEFDLLRWELDHFLEYMVEVYRGVQLEGDEKRIVSEAFDRIASEIASWRRVIVHRDFQSRNIMLRDGRWVLIDFQDALMGPELYDLVALLRDSYVQLAEPVLEQLIRLYLDLCREKGLERPEQQEFMRRFRLQTLQRKLKDAGRFVFIEKVKRKPGFIPFIPASLGYARWAFDGLPELTECRRVLAKAVPELG